LLGVIPEFEFDDCY
jgi:hypothetical protein